MSIPTVNIQDFFKFIGKEYKLNHFELPEAKYENGNISFFETVIICLLCQNTKPHKVLEFGTFNGRTTTNIAANIPDSGTVLTVDLPKSELKNTRFALEGKSKKDENDELGYVGKTNKLYTKHPLKIKSKITQEWMDSAQFPVEDHYKSFDFIFVDASHSYLNVLNDTNNVLQCIKFNGFILWHDYNGWPGVTKALNEVYNAHYNPWNFINIEGTSMVLYYESNS